MNLKVGRVSPLRAVCGLPNCGAHGATRPTASRSQCTRELTWAFHEPGSAGIPAGGLHVSVSPARTPALPETDGFKVPMHGTKVVGAFHEPFGVGDKPTPAPSRERDLARLSGSPPGRGWGWVHGRPMHGPQGLCSGITCAPLAALRGPVRKTIRELLPHRKSRCVPDRCR